MFLLMPYGGTDAKKRRTRTNVSHIKEANLLSKWSVFARLKDNPFTWEQLDYTKGRGTGPDREGHERSADPLLALAQEAPTGYADQKGVMNVLGSLHISYGILYRKDDVQKRLADGKLGEWYDGKDNLINFGARASDAGDVWRTMLGHLLGLKRNGT